MLQVLIAEKNHPTEIYLLIGQSNMAGRAQIPEDAKLPIPNLMLLNDKQEWEGATHPLNQYSSIRKDIKMQRFNLGYGFAQRMLKGQADKTVGLIVNAKGGSKIESWEKGTAFYSEAIRRTKDALKGKKLKGILWHQGESNSARPETYLKQLTELIQALREDFNQPELPFVAGQVFYHPTDKPNTLKINQEISKLPSVVKVTAVVSSNGLSTYDKTHFDEKSILDLGFRYAEKMMALIQ